MNFVLSSGRLHRARRARAVGHPHRGWSHFIHISASDSHLGSLARVSWGGWSNSNCVSSCVTRTRVSPRLNGTAPRRSLNLPNIPSRSILLQVVPGRLGARSCAGYELRFVVGVHDADCLSTFTHAGACLWDFFGLLLHSIGLRLHIDESHVNREYRPWGGRSADLDSGEVLPFSP